MKTYNICNILKNLSEFYKVLRGKYGVASRCKKYSNLISKKWRKNNKENISKGNKF